MKNIYNNQIKLKTPHLLRIYSNTNQNIISDHEKLVKIQKLIKN